ncbi:high-potential iron-sulfur protein [Bradyrhizobium genosp. SA-3]|uniref:high-potential iron-sulfur protein n=1 Tax=Bradyrhizobium genosp. SA-3 TaxID=508868 RepID=UPI001028A08E|nr:high-potential iron-sulfur protein [Bradyrhizobium genosp. SA-3]
MTKTSSRECGPSMTVLLQQLPIQRRAAQPNKAATPSRRDLMSTIGCAALLTGSAFFSAQAQQKISKSEAKYQDKANGNQRCQLCQFFQAPNQCQLVQGGISPNGWCERFAAKM